MGTAKWERRYKREYGEVVGKGCHYTMSIQALLSCPDSKGEVEYLSRVARTPYRFHHFQLENSSAGPRIFAVAGSCLKLR